MKKFTMELVWHNCEECPPKENRNNSLYVTDGVDVYHATWIKDEFNIFTELGFIPLKNACNEYWWADIEQTVEGEPRFKRLIIDDLV